MHLDFVVAGFSKCGTTTLCALLMKHTKIFLPPRFKEPRFFNRPDYALYWNWYRDLFYTAPADALLGEGSVSYTESEFAAISIKRLVKNFPKIKIILITRDPVTRIESSYREMHNSGTDWGIETKFSIEEALVQMPNIIEDTKYWEIIALYLTHLPKEQLQILFQEDLKANPRNVLAKCFDFLGVEQEKVNYSKEKQLNPGSNKYYDTQTLRELRNIKLHPQSAKASYKIPAEVQNQFMPQLNLRQPFGNKALTWSVAAKEQLVNALGSKPNIFLNNYGKNESFWPRYTAFFKELSNELI